MADDPFPKPPGYWAPIPGRNDRLIWILEDGTESVFSWFPPILDDKK